MERKDAVRELFIEELAEVQGGTGIKETVYKLSSYVGVYENLELYSTMACGEEGPC